MVGKPMLIDESMETDTPRSRAVASRRLVALKEAKEEEANMKEASEKEAKEEEAESSEDEELSNVMDVLFANVAHLDKKRRKGTVNDTWEEYWKTINDSPLAIGYSGRN